jgi:membrane associated rhomboid family serine protease
MARNGHLSCTQLKHVDRQSLPIATMSILILNVITVSLQVLYPQILEAFRRNPEALIVGEWWRLITPMFVDPDPYLFIVVKFVGIAIIGFAVEQRVGKLKWLIIYFASGIIGEVAGYAWDPSSAGLSLPLFGLIGALFVLLSVQTVPSTAVVLSISFIASIIGQMIDAWTAVLFAWLAGSLILFTLRQRRFVPLISFFGLLGAILLTILHDIHGPSLISGFILTSLMLMINPLSGKISISKGLS